jgi:hypothetical protein
VSRDRTPLWIQLLFVALLVWLAGSCTVKTINCWRDGGTVVKNTFNWPVCIYPERKR